MQSTHTDAQIGAIVHSDSRAHQTFRDVYQNAKHRESEQKPFTRINAMHYYFVVDSCSVEKYKLCILNTGALLAVISQRITVISRHLDLSFFFHLLIAKFIIIHLLTNEIGSGTFVVHTPRTLSIQMRAFYARQLRLRC